MQPNEVYQLLLNGKRMDPPIYCPQEICNLMFNCWNESPADRPGFEKLKKMLHEIVNNEEPEEMPQETTSSNEGLFQ